VNESDTPLKVASELAFLHCYGPQPSEMGQWRVSTPGLWEMGRIVRDCLADILEFVLESVFEQVRDWSGHRRGHTMGQNWNCARPEGARSRLADTP
jgi:hypothetical protein